MTSLSPYLPGHPAPDQAQRIFHGRGQCYPGLESITLDLFPPVLLLTSFTTPDNNWLKNLHQDINNWWEKIFPDNPFNLVWQDRGVSPATTTLLEGSIPEQHWVKEGNLEYLTDVLHGQNHGLFLDMATGREWVQQHAKSKNILNLFAYTCGFSVAAAAGGANSIINLDMSSNALKTGKRNHARNKLDHGVRYLAHDLFKTFGKLKKMSPYDLIIVDPPSFQQGSFIATKDYPKVLRRLPGFLASGGEALLCLNAPELSLRFLKQQVETAAPELEFIEQLANPASFRETDTDKGLKVLLYRLKNETSEDKYDHR